MLIFMAGKPSPLGQLAQFNLPILIWVYKNLIIMNINLDTNQKKAKNLDNKPNKPLFSIWLMLSFVFIIIFGHMKSNVEKY